MSLFRKTLLTLAAAAAVSSPALAQQRLRYSDLDLTTDRGIETLRRRIDSVARQECVGEEGTGSRTNGGSARCERSVRSQLVRSLPAATRQRLEPASGAAVTPAR